MNSTTLSSLLRKCRGTGRWDVVVETASTVLRGVLTSWTGRSLWLVIDGDTDVVLPTASIVGIRAA